MADFAGQATLLVPAEAYREAQDQLPEILAKRRAGSGPELAALHELDGLVQVVDTDDYLQLRDEAMTRIGRRDPDDWPVLALALAADSPVWTEDQDFFGTGVATWTTDRVEIYLGNASRAGAARRSAP
jgi:predicted nucleic acid-binding protein